MVGLGLLPGGVHFAGVLTNLLDGVEQFEQSVLPGADQAAVLVGVAGKVLELLRIADRAAVELLLELGELAAKVRNLELQVVLLAVHLVQLGLDGLVLSL